MFISRLMSLPLQSYHARWVGHGLSFINHHLLQYW